MSDRPHTIEEIQDHWLRNRSADGTDWLQALGAVYDLAVSGERARLREKVEAMRAGASDERERLRRMGHSTERMGAKVAAFNAVLALSESES